MATKSSPESDTTVPPALKDANVKRPGAPTLASVPPAKPPTMKGKSLGVPPANKRFGK
jgi:hypothetical protein